MLGALVAMDVDYLRANPRTPRLYSSGVVYEPEPADQEDWKTIDTVLRDGHGDCEDLAAWLAAERIVKDAIPARCAFRYRPVQVGGGRVVDLYHILTQHPAGSIEDPSRVLGMTSFSLTG